MAYLDTWSVVQALPAKWVQFSEYERYWYTGMMIAGDGVWYACLINQGWGMGDLPFYRSDDAGYTWTEVSGLNSIYDCCASADGSIVYATGLHTKKIYKSTDHGLTFSEIYTSENWVSSICCSDDGEIVYATTSNSIIIKSTNAGASWSTVLSVSSPDDFWRINCSGDGAKVTMTGYENKLYISTNGGSTWSTTPPNAGAPLARWAGIVSRDGSVMYAASNLHVENEEISYIYKSTNDGATWSIAYEVSAYWESLGCTSDGSKIIALEQFAGIYASDDSGSTWALVQPTPGGLTEWLFDSNATKSLSPDGYMAFVGGYGTKGPWQSPSTLMILSITPDNGTFRGGTPVTILGGSFMPDAIATIDGNELIDTVVVDQGTITGITPPGTLGAKDVSVTNP